MNIAAYFNTATGQWVARRKVITPHMAGDGAYRENVYGYGKELVDCLDDLASKITTNVKSLVCRVRLHNKHTCKVIYPLQ